MSETAINKPLNGWWVFAAFFLFFAVIVLVNSVFITMALRSHSGVVTEDAYRKGLTYNETLQQARNQPAMSSAFHFKDNIVYWSLSGKDNQPIENADITAKFQRPVKDGDDFSARLHPSGNGVYSSEVEFPVKGSWKVILSAKWDDKTYQTTQELIVP